MDNMELWYRLHKRQTASGAPPITFQGGGQPIRSWEITGAAGGVGTRTRNLLPMSSALFSGMSADKGSYILNIAGAASALERVIFGSWTKSNAYVMPFGAGTYTYSLSITAINGGRVCDAIVRRSEHGTGDWQVLSNGQHVTINADDRWLILLYMSPAAGQVYNCRVMLQFEAGSTAHAIEPYGYKIPVTCAGTTTDIYIGTSPLYAGDKVTYADTDTAIPTSSGTNTLTVGTSVQPSNIKLACGGLSAGSGGYFAQRYEISPD